MMDPLDLKDRLAHTWPAFFARHGQFTPVQRQAIPPILAGRDTLVIGATASGKTEAVIAPLLERHVLGGPARGELWVLYICPTRALARDLHARLDPPLEELRVALGLKTGDTGPVSAEHPPTVLVTTPESTDSLLTRAARLFIPLRAIVLDEIHLFDKSPRGDHLRCLLRRIEWVRAYRPPGSPETLPVHPPAQCVALSATVADPAGVAGRYLSEPTVVEVAGRRAIQAEIVPIATLADVARALATRAAKKTLVFCNTRHEVEQVATYLRAHLPYEALVLVHYSNLDTTLRREVETQFAQASVALCVASSTLESGIDIGSIDDVVLVGPPPSYSSFLQRIGRGSRRRDTTAVLCISRSADEYLRFQALVDRAVGTAGPPSTGCDPAYLFRPSVLVQQIFSMLKGSPTGGLRLADLRRVAPDEVNEDVLRRVLDHLVATDYLTRGRPGEWRPGRELDALVDEHEIYSNIGGEALGALVVDAYTGRPIAQTERPRRKGETVLIGGRAQEVAWRDRYTFGVRPGQRAAVDEVLRVHAQPFAVPLDITRAVADRIGVPPGQLLTLADGAGSWLFHFWGDVYGALLAAILRAHFPAGADQAPIEPWNAYCLLLPTHVAALPPWDSTLAEEELHALARRIEPTLELGRFHALLPPALARQVVVEHVNLGCFEKLYRAAPLVDCPTGLRDTLRALL